MTKVEVHMHGYLCVVYYALCMHFGRDINLIWGIFTAHANVCSPDLMKETALGEGD